MGREWCGAWGGCEHQILGARSGQEPSLKCSSFCRIVTEQIQLCLVATQAGAGSAQPRRPMVHLGLFLLLDKKSPAAKLLLEQRLFAV